MFKLNNAEKPHLLPHGQTLYSVMIENARNISDNIGAECRHKNFIAVRKSQEPLVPQTNLAKIVGYAIAVQRKNTRLTQRQLAGKLGIETVMTCLVF
jgi:hypothetical protein